MNNAPSFVTDSKITKIAEAYARDTINLAAKSFQTRLDWSDESIAHVEAILVKLCDSMPTAKPPDEMIWTFAKGFGSYVGEVFRKNHGGEWGIITHGANSVPGIRWKADVLFWPWGRVQQRLVEGDENNVLHYYKWLLSGGGAASLAK